MTQIHLKYCEQFAYVLSSPSWTLRISWTYTGIVPEVLLTQIGLCDPVLCYEMSTNKVTSSIQKVSHSCRLKPWVAQHEQPYDYIP